MDVTTGFITASGLAIAAGLVAEVWLRWRYGFGNPLIYLAHPDIGYVLAPNQRTRRYGNRIEINEFSMRSGAIAPQRPTDTLRILLLGDSVANGGWWLDQSQTISTLLERALHQTVPHYAQVEVLNASANSWGPRNELAYLKAFGSFEAQVVVVLLNTDDLFAAAPSSCRVGVDPGYPTHRPPLALVEVAQRIGIIPVPELSPTQQEKDPLAENLNAIAEIGAIAHQAQSHLLVAMTPLKREVQEPGSREYERNARQRLLDLTQAHQISYLDFLSAFQAADAAAFYHDHIHLNLTGNQFVVERLATSITQLLMASEHQEAS